MRKWLDKATVSASWFSSLALAALLIAFLGYILTHAWPALNSRLFFGETPAMDALLLRRPVFDGIWPALIGSLTLIVVSASIAVPIGVGAGIFLVAYAPPRWRMVTEGAVDVLSGVPSIVMGLFGLALILLLRRTFMPDANTCLLLAAGCIALLALPGLVRATQNALTGLPPAYMMTGPSLGLSRWQNLRYLLLPAASQGILSGIILTIGRAAEDTAVILLTGVVARTGLPGGLSEKFEALPFRIYVHASEYRNEMELAQGFACAAVLLLLTAILFMLATWLQGRLETRWNR